MLSEPGSGINWLQTAASVGYLKEQKSAFYHASIKANKVTDSDRVTLSHPCHQPESIIPPSLLSTKNTVSKQASVHVLLNEQHAVHSSVAGINHPVACNITDQHISLKLHYTARNSELCTTWESAVCKGNHPMEAVAGMGGVKWLRGDITYWSDVCRIVHHNIFL